jgi:cytochrome bd-type quinol oxidase subunit 2
MTQAQRRFAIAAYLLILAILLSIWYGYWKLGLLGQHHHTPGQMATLLVQAAIPMAFSVMSCCACWMMSIGRRGWAVAFTVVLVAYLGLAGTLAFQCL